MKILTIVGARPQFVKAAAVSRAIARHNAATETKGARLEELIVHTGQHFSDNMSQLFFDEMQIPRPAFQLAVHSLSHGAMTGRMLEQTESLMQEQKPDTVMVYGDTNSTLAGALAAAKLHIPVVHVEAGLRSYNMDMPEEINRILVDRISTILCCPTAQAVRNLEAEGFASFSSTVAHTGDVMQDAALHYSAISAEKSTVLQRLALVGHSFLLCTIHRAENTDNPERLAAIAQALNRLSRERKIVLPLHPRTRQSLQAAGIALHFDPVDPVGYFDMLELLKQTDAVLTDSGGLQKEAYFFKKPCLTIRDQTEWVELVSSGVNMLVPPDPEAIADALAVMLGHSPDFSKQLYGNGMAADNIVKLLQ